MANNLTAAEKQMMGMSLDYVSEALAPIIQTSNYKFSTIPDGMNSTIETQVPLRRPEPYDITPGHNPKQAADFEIAERQIVCDQWKGMDFAFDDLEFAETGVRALPMAVETSLDSLVNKVVTDYMTELYQGTYGAYGAVNTLPFADDTTKPFTQGKKILKQQFCPIQRGRMNAFWTEEAEAEAMELRVFQDASFNGTGSVLEGKSPKMPFGFNQWCPQVMPTHTAGGASGYLLDGAVTDAINLDSQGREVYEVSVDTGTGDFAVGDIINIAGDTENYVVRAWNSGTGVITIFPKPRVALADNAAVSTAYADHGVNILAHQNAMAFVTRPMKANVPSNVTYGMLQDNKTGISIAYEVERQNNQTRREYKLFYGLELIRPEFAMRIVQDPNG